jgi:hypothetical protein
MAQLMAGGVRCDIDIVVLEKDGTLTDFHAAWGGRYARSVAAVVKAARGDNTLKAALYHTLAINAADGRFLLNCPVVSIKIGDKAVMVATVLHRSGIEWSKAQEIVAEHMLPVLTAPSEPQQITSRNVYAHGNPRGCAWLFQSTTTKQSRNTGGIASTWD